MCRLLLDKVLSQGKGHLQGQGLKPADTEFACVSPFHVAGNLKDLSFESKGFLRSDLDPCSDDTWVCMVRSSPAQYIKTQEDIPLSFHVQFMI